jgi:choice-of-anchor C domain-containing protein
MRQFLLLVLVAVVLTAPAICAPVNLLTNGSFETGSYAEGGSKYQTLNAVSGAMDGWAVTGGSIDWISGYWQSAEGGRSLDLSGNSLGSISQTVSNLDLNTTYKLAFSLSGNPDNDGGNRTGNVTVGAFSQDFAYNTTTYGNTLGDMKWITVSYLFKPSATTQTLMFTSTAAGGFWGPALDNVSLTAVPEPTLPVLFGTLLVIVPLARR